MLLKFHTATIVYCCARFYCTKVCRFVVPRPVVGAKLKTMKIDPTIFRSVITPELLQLKALFDKHEYSLRIAGGAVRDLLMNICPVDVDLATTATPEEMKRMFEVEKVRMLNRRGESHGTVTCRINQTENFEVTTLRVDLLCDGRRAEVEFTKDWLLDANRRDLTFNAMFADFEGNVYDYFGGIEDLKNRRVAFVGDAEARIQEDYLRILRYFRFYGRIADAPNNHDQNTLDAIRRNAEGLSGVSGERIWFELKKILVGNYGDSLMRTLYECGIFPYIALPGNANLQEFATVYKRSIQLRPSPMTLLSSLFCNLDEIHAFDKRLKISSAERLMSVNILHNRHEQLWQRVDQTAEKKIKTRCFETFARKVETESFNRVCELLKYNGNEEVLKIIKTWHWPVFPLNGTRLIEELEVRGAKLSPILLRLFKIWVESDWSLDEDQLVEAARKLPPEAELFADFEEEKRKERWKTFRRQ